MLVCLGGEVFIVGEADFGRGFDESGGVCAAGLRVSLFDECLRGDSDDFSETGVVFSGHDLEVFKERFGEVALDTDHGSRIIHVAVLYTG